MTIKKIFIASQLLICLLIAASILHDLKQRQEIKDRDAKIEQLLDLNKKANKNNCNDALVQIGARMSLYHQKLLDLGVKPNDPVFTVGKR